MPTPADLSLYSDAALYDATYQRRRGDVAYYVHLATTLGEGARVLEYGVGSGRVALALARAGVNVVGVDPSEPMLALLNEKLARSSRAVQERVRVVRGDMRQVRLREAAFDLVLAPFNVVLHLDDHREMARWLAGVQRHARPGAELCFDVSVPHADDLASDPDDWHHAPRFRHPLTKAWTRQSERFEYDAQRQVLWVDTELRAEGSRDVARVSLVHRQWFPRELEAVLHYNGMTDIRFFADFTELPPDDSVDSLVVRCRTPEQP